MNKYALFYSDVTFEKHIQALHYLIERTVVYPYTIIKVGTFEELDDFAKKNGIKFTRRGRTYGR